MTTVASQPQSLLPGAPGAPSVGIRTLRSLRQGPEPTERLQKKIDTTYDYFLQEVDSVIGDLITNLLCEQPIDVPGAMLQYLNNRNNADKAAEQAVSNGGVSPPRPAIEDTSRAENAADVAGTEEAAEAAEAAAAKKRKDKRPKKEQKLYLATSIGPIVSKLVNRIAVTRPKRVVAFLCEELQTMIYGTEDERELRLTQEVETASRFDMYKGQNGPRVSLKAPEQPVVMPATAPAVSRDAESMEPPADKPASAAHDLLGNDATASETDTEAAAQVGEAAAPTAKPVLQKVQFAVIGMDGSGKSSVMNMLQGRAEASTKPTIGFRPVTMQLGEALQVRFYDIGGGPKIREIWPQYFHDVHGVLYVVDSTDSEERAAEARAIFDTALSHEFVAKKPLLVLGTKQDVEGAAGEEALRARYGLEGLAHASLAVCKAVGEAEEVDVRVEVGLEWLIKEAQDNFEALAVRVAKDSATKVKDDQKRRLARERKVLKNKISIAFLDLLSEENKPDLGDKPPNPEDQFTEEEGLNFLSSELGEEVAAMPQEALEISAMVGYQRLALQIVGSLKVPISKKKEPMSWLEIHDLIVEIREELGLLKPDFAAVGTFN